MIDVDTLISELKEHCGITSEWDTNTCLLLLNRSYWELLDKFKFREKEKVYSFDTAEGTQQYEIETILDGDPFEAVRTLSIVDPDTLKNTTLDRMTLHEYRNNYHEPDDNYDKPTHYIREGNMMYLYPTPDQEYEVHIHYWSTLSDLAEDGDVELPPNWHEILLLGAVWRGFLKLSDWPRLQNARLLQANLIEGTKPTEAKEEEDSHNAGLNISGYSGEL